MHSVLSPSAANRWVNCAGSIALCASLLSSTDAPRVQVDTSASEEGTAAHYFAEQSIRDVSRSLAPVKVGSIAPNGVVYTDEMKTAVMTYVDYVVGLQRKYFDFNGIVEKTVRCDDIHPDCFGTPDFALFVRDNAGKNPRLIVVDYKHGRVPVEVFENWQAIIYSSGLLYSVFGDGDIPDDLVIELVIVQPRAQHRDGVTRPWVTDIATLAPLWEKARIAAHAAIDGIGTLRPGPHCARCPSRLSCAAFTKAVGAMCDFAEEGVRSDLDVQELGVEWVLCNRAIQMLKARRDAAEVQLKHITCSGQQVDAVSIVNTKGRVQWNCDDEAIIAIAAGQNVDVAKPKQALTPKQSIDKGLSKTIVDSLSHRPKGGIKITEATTNRARFVFSQGNPS